MLTKDNIVKLADWGTGKDIENTNAKTYVGTPLYMSPEQRKGRLYEKQAEFEIQKANTDVW